MTEVLQALLDLALPQTCAGCRTPGRLWCPTCAGELDRWAAAPVGNAAPRPAPPGFPCSTTAAPYDGVVRAALLAHKEQGARVLSAPLGALLAAAVFRLPDGAGRPLLLIPVPSSRGAVRQRGYDHAWRLALAAARSLSASGAPASAARCLAPARQVADQAGLGSAQRAANLAGALQVSERGRRCVAAGALVILVDDVVTTGASLTEAARALAAAGITVHGAATVAATQRVSPPARHRCQG